jgi:hypothetical protein
MILGVANTASTPTTLTATTTGIGLTVQCTGSAMFFNSATGNGVAGRTNAANRYGFSAANVGPAGGGAALAASGINNDGVLANTDNQDKRAVVGQNRATNAQGTLASGLGDGVIGEADNVGFGGYGVWAIHPSGLGSPALVANGDAYVGGDLYVSGSKNFRIDHPADPGGKWLVHAAVEAPALQTLYDGTVELDASGEAQIDLPAYFSALNTDPRYQLTALGAPMPNLHVVTDVGPNGFRIAGGLPGGRVSWQVTGVRHDSYAVQHPLVPEIAKSDTQLHLAESFRTVDRRSAHRRG